jgi:anti-sigma factor RsiW
MTCVEWQEKLDAYLDGELSLADARAVAEHLRSCADCAAECLSRAQMRLAVRSAGERYKPETAFRARIEKQFTSSQSSSKSRLWFPVLAGSLVVVAVLMFILIIGRQPKPDLLLGELADLHVATLASSNPVDVASTDRHTVKPWFEGKIPFTFNLPELQDTGFSLVGGKVAYLSQAPGAELIFRIRQHQISVFIFQERVWRGIRSVNDVQNVKSFGARTWTHNDLRYFVIGDVGGPDLDRLAGLMKAAE